MPKTTTCLWFDTQGEEAAQLYTSIFPNSSITDTMRYGPNQPGEEGKVMTVAFDIDGRSFVALNGGPQFTFNEAISIQVDCEDQSEVDDYWSKLTADGGEEDPCGWLKDKFGLSWQIVPKALNELLSDPNPARAQAAMQAMLQMTKMDVAQLHAAADSA